MSRERVTFASVCAGIEAASVAWKPLGWRAAWVAEIEPFPCAVLAHRYPDVPNLGDMRALAPRVLAGEIEAPGVLCGGTPCQAFSVAGLRRSLDDARGNLSLKFVGLANAIDHVRAARGEPPCIVFWENVWGNARVSGNAAVSNPGLVFWAGSVGTENGTLTVYATQGGPIEVTRGCFRGTPEEFLAASAEKHDARVQHAYPGLTDRQLIAQKSTRPKRPRVFCASLADVFDNAVPTSWRADLFQLIERTPHLDWLVLTKRVGNVAPMMLEVAQYLFWLDHLETAHLPANVWLGATICNQEEADRDIPKLLQIPAAKRFLSIEPMLGPVDISDWLDDGSTHMALAGTLNWVICGGETGPGARPMHPAWVRSLRDQCNAADVPFFFKQWGAWRPPKDGEEYDTSKGCAQRAPAFIVADTGTVHCFENEGTKDGGAVMLRVSRKKAGRQLDGREWNEAPQ